MNKLGFTLVEILVAMSIISILFAIAVPGYKFYIDKAKTAQAFSDLNEIKAAIFALDADTGELPGHQTWDKARKKKNKIWNLNFPHAGIVWTDGKFDNWDGPYMYWIGRDPWDNWYFFDANYMTRGKMYIVVGSFGPNGKGKNKGKGERDSDDVIIILAPSPR